MISCSQRGFDTSTFLPCCWHYLYQLLLVDLSVWTPQQIWLSAFASRSFSLDSTTDLISLPLRSLNISWPCWPRNLIEDWWINGISFPPISSCRSYGVLIVEVLLFVLPIPDFFMTRFLHLVSLASIILVLFRKVQPGWEVLCSNQHFLQLLSCHLHRFSETVWSLFSSFGTHCLVWSLEDLQAG